MRNLALALVTLVVVTAWVVIPTPRAAAQAAGLAPVEPDTLRESPPGSGPFPARQLGQPDDHPGARLAVRGRVTPSTSAVTASGPESTGRPGAARPLRGLASFVGPGYGPRYLALPAGPGVTVYICGPVSCVVRTSTDAGPDLAMQRAGRVADLSYADFRAICGCDPYVVGLVRVTVAPIPAPPVTATAP